MCAHPLTLLAVFLILTSEKETVLRCVNPVSSLTAHSPSNAADNVNTAVFLKGVNKSFWKFETVFLSNEVCLHASIEEQLLCMWTLLWWCRRAVVA